MRIVFSKSAYVALLAETDEKITTETGGVFLGCFINDTWYIIETIDPGPKSVFKPEYFEYDQPYTFHLINKRSRLYCEPLTLIGLWHRHPGSFDVFSVTDDGTNTKYAKLSPNGAISLLVNIDPVFRISAYHISHQNGYTRTPYVVGDEHIPARYLQLKPADGLLSHINGYGMRIAAEWIRQLGLKDYVSSIAKRLQPFDPGQAERGSGRPSNIISFPRAATSEMPSRAAAGNCQENEVHGQPEVCLSNAEHAAWESEIRERIIDEAVDEIGYLSDILGFKFSIHWAENQMHLVQQAGGQEETVLRFAYSQAADHCYCIIGSQTYLCEKNMFALSNRANQPNDAARETSGRPGNGHQEPTSGDAEMFSNAGNGIRSMYDQVKDEAQRILRSRIRHDD